MKHKMRIEELDESIADDLGALEILVRNRNALNLYDLNQYCEEFYCALLNEVLKNKYPGLRLVSANTPSEPNCRGIDLIDEKNKLIVQVTSDASNYKVKDTFAKIKEKYQGFTLYFVFIGGMQTKIDLRTIRPSKNIKCGRANLLCPQDLIKLLKGRSLVDHEKVAKILHDRLGGEARKIGVEALWEFICQIAELFKFTSHVRQMVKNLQMLSQKDVFVTDVKSRINHYVGHQIQDSLPQLEYARLIWATKVGIYANLLSIEHCVGEIGCMERDDARSLDVRETKCWVDKLWQTITDTIKMMCRETGVSEDVAFTELDMRTRIR